jgi:hypothetical protein
MTVCWQKCKDITRTIHRKNAKFSIHVMKACRGNGAIAPFILNLSSRLRSVVSLIPWPLYSPPPVERAPDTRWIWCLVVTSYGEEKYLSSLPGSEPQIFPTCRLVSIPTTFTIHWQVNKLESLVNTKWKIVMCSAEWMTSLLCSNIIIVHVTSWIQYHSDFVYIQCLCL